jgi:hypothetical protein
MNIEGILENHKEVSILMSPLRGWGSMNLNFCAEIRVIPSSGKPS